MTEEIINEKKEPEKVVVEEMKNLTGLPPYPTMNEEEQEQMWEEIAHEFAKPESLRRNNNAIHDSYRLPEATFYYRIRKPEFKKRVVEIALNEAKTWVPELMNVLREKAITDRSEKSIEMALKYVADVADRLDMTTKGEKIGIVNESLMAKAMEIYATNNQGKICSPEKSI
jgi:hypothetical protein